MTTEFETYLVNLAEHEQVKSKALLTNPRDQILVNAGVKLNWMGDYLANPNILWSEVTEMNISKIQFTGSNPDWNQILIKDCDRDPNKFIQIINQNADIQIKFLSESSFDPALPILVRKSEDEGKYKVLDGMHRFVGALVNRQNTVKVYFPENEDGILPWCEAHVVYDLIRGFIKNAKDKEGELQLYHALKLLMRTYGNVRDLLINRFDTANVDDKVVKRIVQDALKT
jgi:hypothetical protein